MIQLRIAVLGLLLFSCGETDKKSQSEVPKGIPLMLKYAKGFSVTNYDGYKVIKVSKPWPGAQRSFQYILLDKAHTDDFTQRDSIDAIIKGRPDKIVVTSTTHVPHLELLEVEKTLVGFPGTDYISSKKTRRLIDGGNIRELGKNESINTEVLLELNPDAVIGFGVEGVNKTFETIKNTGIPVLYNGDWVEASPLAKAEWIKFFGSLFNKEKEADSIFNVIEETYMGAKVLATKAKKRPKVMSGAMHKDIWYLPNGSSPEAQFMNDANLDYLWNETTGNGSLALSFEVVYNKAQNADIWLSPSYYSSLDQIKDASKLYTNFKPFKTKNVFSFSVTTGETGGVLYYEIGTARPDLVLKDIIKICHPELLVDYTPTFYKRLK